MTRWLFFLLLLLNLLLFLWGYRQQTPESLSAAPPLPPNTPSIQLLSEYKADATPQQQPEIATIQPNSLIQDPVIVPSAAATTENKAAKPAAPVVAQATNQARCVLLGPFEQQAEASAFATSLDADKFDASIVMKSEQRQSGYWVLADPDSDNEKPLLARLKKAGIEDVWRFTKGDLAGIVSLGLYSRRSRAEGRLKAVQKKGINANIRPRFIEETAYWAQTIQLGPKEKASENLEAMFRQHQKLHYPPPECAEVANNAAIP